MKETRPNISKSFISRVGDFDQDGKAINWAFNGSNHPESVGTYLSKDWLIIGGYTIKELMEIKDSYEYESQG